MNTKTISNMISNNIGISIAVFAAAAVLALGALPASAQTVSASVSASAQLKANEGVRLSTIIARGDTDIEARITALTKLNTRVQEMKNGSAALKANIASQIQTNISNLTALKAKIDADTDAATARSDSQSIFNSYRIYALLVPQTWILASADRVTAIAQLMTTLGAKIQARISADQAAGKDVTALAAAYADMNAKIADANTHAAAAEASVSGLTPDQGDKTKAAANRAALVAARGHIKMAAQALQAARADIKTILQGLKALGGSASVTASTTVSQ